MEISGEVDITIDQYADFEIDLDVDRLAEELATDHNFVDDAILHAHVEEYCDSYVADRVSERVDEEIEERKLVDDNNLQAQVEEYCDSYVADCVEDKVQEEIAGVRLDVSDNTDAIDELREQIRGLQPDNNYVRINDLRTIIEEVARAEICIAFAAGHHKMQEKLNKVPPPNGLTNSNWGEENKEG